METLLRALIMVFSLSAAAAPIEGAIDITREDAVKNRDSLLKDRDYKCLTEGRLFKSLPAKVTANSRTTFCVAGLTPPAAQVEQFNFRARLKDVGISRMEFEGQTVTFKKSQPVAVNGKEYVFIAKNLRPCTVNSNYADFQVFISDGTSETLIRDFNCVDTSDGPSVASWDLLWSGDLDGDGKPDFYTTTAPDGAHFTDSLYLSSQAAPGEVVKLVSSKAY